MMGPMAYPDKPEPRVHVSWDKGAVEVKADSETLALGKKVSLTITGTVTGYAMQDYGCSLDLTPKSLTVTSQGGTDGEPVAKTMTESIREMGTKTKKKVGGYA